MYEIKYLHCCSCYKVRIGTHKSLSMHHYILHFITLFPVGHVYSGLADGRIIRFDQECVTYTTVARMGKPPYDKCGKEYM